MVLHIITSVKREKENIVALKTRRYDDYEEQEATLSQLYEFQIKIVNDIKNKILPKDERPSYGISGS